MDFVAVVDQAIALLRQRGRVTYRTLKRQFQLDDDVLEDLTVELIKGQRLAADEDGEVLVWIGEAAAPAAPAAVAPTPAPLGLHPAVSRREDSHVPQCPGRRTEAGHSPVCRPERVDGTARRPRPGRGAPAPQSRAGTDDGRRPSLRRDRQPGHGGWDHGALWGTAGP